MEEELFGDGSVGAGHGGLHFKYFKQTFKFRLNLLLNHLIKLLNLLIRKHLPLHKSQIRLFNQPLLFPLPILRHILQLNNQLFRLVNIQLIYSQLVVVVDYV